MIQSTEHLIAVLAELGKTPSSCEFFINDDGSLTVTGVDDALVQAAIAAVDPIAVADAALLAEVANARALKKLELKGERDLMCVRNVTAIGYVWQADPISQQLLASKIALCSAGGALPYIWRTADDVDYMVTSLSDLVTIAEAMSSQAEQAYQHYWLKKAEVDNATAVAEVEAVQWML